MATPKSTASGKGAARPPLVTSFQTGGNTGAGIWKKISSFFTAPPINANGKKAVAVVRGTGLGIVNGKQTLPGPTAGKGGSGGGGGGSTTPDALTFAPASAMKFNLPPHQWSLLPNPSRTNTAAGVNDSDPDHSMRRARMWYYGGAYATATAGLLTPPSGGIGGNAADAHSNLNNIGFDNPQDTYWGFQFLWNPEALTTGIARNSNVVPSSLDAHAALNGLFTAMEAISFKIVINRINDFACAKANYELAANSGLSNTNFSNYYVPGGNPGVIQNFSTQFKELMTQGTMADIEYIYRMINGSGQKGKSWVNGLGRKTADLAFLSPTAIALQFGPTANSLSYIGWIERMDVQHLQFTQDMIPIHSEVIISLNGFSRVSLSGA